MNSTGVEQEAEDAIEKSNVVAEMARLSRIAEGEEAEARRSEKQATEWAEQARVARDRATLARMALKRYVCVVASDWSREEPITAPDLAPTCSHGIPRERCATHAFEKAVR